MDGGKGGGDAVIYTHKDAEGPLPQRRPFLLNGFLYPAGWLAGASPEELAERGIVVTETPAKEPAAPRAYVPEADDVRREAKRRMIALFDARDPDHLNVLISNAVREQGRLQAVLSGIPGVSAPRAWTEEEAARARYLWAADNALEAIRAASNLLEPSPPADYADDKHWPAHG